MTPRKPDRIAGDIAADLANYAFRELRNLEPADRAVVASVLLDRLGETVLLEVRRVRRDAVNELRSTSPTRNVLWTYGAIGDLLDVSAERARQYATEEL